MNPVAEALTGYSVDAMNKGLAEVFPPQLMKKYHFIGP